MAASNPNATLSKKSAVVAKVDMPGVPAGTRGKVVLVNGLSWIRYWVRFENGITRGSMNRNALATADEWRRHLSGEDEAESGAVVAAGDGGAEAADDGGSVVTANGTAVPAKLIERSRAARARLAA